MRSTLVMSFIGAASLAAALLVGCGDNDAKPVVVTSKAGQSCARTADCAEGLICIANVCYQTAPPAPGGEGGDTSVTPIPVGPVLGRDGESCTSRRDCVEGLGCFSNRCSAMPPAMMGEGGAAGARAFSWASAVRVAASMPIATRLGLRPEPDEQHRYL